ncbi:hypothetical protein ES703_19907 [subsurface metagenome]
MNPQINKAPISRTITYPLFFFRAVFITLGHEIGREVKSMAYIVKSAVRGLIKGMRASGDFFDELDALIKRRCALAIKRAKANGRKTLRGVDV